MSETPTTKQIPDLEVGWSFAEPGIFYVAARVPGDADAVKNWWRDNRESFAKTRWKGVKEVSLLENARKARASAAGVPPYASATIPSIYLVGAYMGQVDDQPTITIHDDGSFTMEILS